MLDRLPSEVLVYEICQYLGLKDVMSLLSCFEAASSTGGKEAPPRPKAKYTDLHGALWVHPKYATVSVATLEAYVEPQGVNAMFHAMGEHLDEREEPDAMVFASVSGMSLNGHRLVHRMRVGRWPNERLMMHAFPNPVVQHVVVPLGARLRISLMLTGDVMVVDDESECVDVYVLAFDMTEPYHKLCALCDVVDPPKPVILVGMQTTARRLSGKDLARAKGYAAYLESGHPEFNQLLPRVICKIALVHQYNIVPPSSECVLS